MNDKLEDLMRRGILMPLLYLGIAILFIFFGKFLFAENVVYIVMVLMEPPMTSITTLQTGYFSTIMLLGTIVFIAALVLLSIRYGLTKTAVGLILANFAGMWVVGTAGTPLWLVNAVLWTMFMEIQTIILLIVVAIFIGMGLVLCDMDDRLQKVGRVIKTLFRRFFLAPRT